MILWMPESGGGMPQREWSSMRRPREAGRVGAVGALQEYVLGSLWQGGASASEALPTEW